MRLIFLYRLCAFFCRFLWVATILYVSTTMTIVFFNVRHRSRSVYPPFIVRLNGALIISVLQVPTRSVYTSPTGLCFVPLFIRGFYSFSIRSTYQYVVVHYFYFYRLGSPYRARSGYGHARRYRCARGFYFFVGWVRISCRPSPAKANNSAFR